MSSPSQVETSKTTKPKISYTFKLKMKLEYCTYTFLNMWTTADYVFLVLTKQDLYNQIKHGYQ